MHFPKTGKDIHYTIHLAMQEVGKQHQRITAYAVFAYLQQEQYDITLAQVQRAMIFMAKRKDRDFDRIPAHYVFRNNRQQ